MRLYFGFKSHILRPSKRTFGTAMNNQNIFDLEAKEYVSPGVLLKRLMLRAGFSRNEWHESFQNEVARSIGTASKLSDIFADRRKIPLRDIMPLLGTLELPPEKLNYYAAEFLKAHIEPSLASFISTPASNNILQLMNEKNAQLRLDFAFAQKAIFDMTGQQNKALRNRSEQLKTISTLKLELAKSRSNSATKTLKTIALNETHLRFAQSDLNPSNSSSTTDVIAYEKAFSDDFDILDHHEELIEKKLEEREARYDRDLEQEFQSNVDFEEKMLQQLQKVIFEITDFAKKSASSISLMQALIPVDLPELLVAFGQQRKELGKITERNFEYLPQIRNLENLKMVILTLWANEDEQRFADVMDAMALLKDITNENYAKKFSNEIIKLTFQDFLKNLIQQFLKDFPAIYQMFSISSPSFSKHNLTNMDFFSYVEKLSRLIDAHGSLATVTEFLYSNTQTKLTKPFIKKVVFNYCFYVHTSFNFGYNTLNSFEQRSTDKLSDRFKHKFKQLNGLKLAIPQTETMLDELMHSKEFRASCEAEVTKLLESLFVDEEGDKELEMLNRFLKEKFAKD